MPWNETVWKKYLEGKASKKELELLEEYFKEGDLEAWNTFIAGEQLPGTAMPPEKEKRMRQYLLQQMGKPRSRVYSLFTGRRIAAAAAVFLLFGIAWLLRQQRSTIPAPVAGVPEWDTIVPAGNTMRAVTLADGTKIWLNRRSELLVSKTYSKERRVQLKGEGYFEVTAAETHPFYVETGQVQTVVLGTAFNIEHTQTDKAVRVSLLKGKVKVMHQQDTASAISLRPDHMAIATDSGTVISTAEVDVNTAAAWIKGDLVMNNIPLADALSKLAAYYDIQIICPPGLAAGKMVTSLYHRHQSWTQTLQHMLFIAQLTYVTDKNGTIHITKNQL